MFKHIQRSPPHAQWRGWIEDTVTGVAAYKGMGLAFLLTCARTRKWHRTPMKMPQRQKALHKVCWRKRDCPTKLRPKFPGICNCCSAPWVVRETDHAVKRKLTRVFLVPTPGQGQFHNNPFPAEGVTDGLKMLFGCFILHAMQDLEFPSRTRF